MTITADLGKAGAVGGGRRRVVWTRGRRITFGIIGFGSLLIALTGFVGSYTAVRDLAEEKGFGWFAAIFPLGIDIGIITMLALDLALTWVDLRYPLLRHIAWLLTVATVAFNAFSSYPDILASFMHAAIPLLFIAITEAVRHAIAIATAREEGREDYALSLGRWLLAPWSTWLIWRSRKLWPSTISSYEVALALYQEKLDYRRELRDAYGWRWRRKATREELRPLRRSRLGYAVRPAAELRRPEREDLAEQSAPTAPTTPGVVLEKVPASHPPALSPASASASPEPEDAAEHERAQCPPADRVRAGTEPAEEPLLEHPREDLFAGDTPADQEAEAAEDEDPLEWREPETGQAGHPAGGQASADVDEAEDEEGPVEDEEGPDEGDDPAAAPPPTIELGPAPANESKRQRAERIYLAHQKAGVELTRKDLTRWAGYQNEGSGRSAYNDLERKHGPIVVGEAAWETGGAELATVPS
ncbi:DUF2637 domain-containing protein [Streptomyces sp. RK31]|uniref:DUF2637 domain-containing protein n=1 Tax=Streptomyces sp. RK31 TaxID=2824892 RepID=UPI001B365FAB|nr:DUF2637 domain-containing protein [Streptomyces sp. RK31]MBQ0972925.1 DUF2637 domain-containing protein [Streptomyces sp. RK31]